MESAEALIKKHGDFEKSLAAQEEKFQALAEFETKQIDEFNNEVLDEVSSRNKTLVEKRSQLLKKSAVRKKKLEVSRDIQLFQRDSESLSLWITAKEKFVKSLAPDSDPELNKVRLSSLGKHQAILESQEFRVTDICKTAEKLVSDQHPESEVVTNKKKELLEAWARLKFLVTERQQKLFEAYEIQRFNRDADETIAWIAEKDSVHSADDFGKDLASVQTLQRKHEGIERDLAALEDRVRTINQEAKRLCSIHGEHAEQINGKNDQIEKSWDELVAAAKERKKKLDESYYLHRFLADYRDLSLWINDMKAVISADELAKDVSGAEALLERHQEHKSEIDAREDSFRATAEAGKMLLESDHYASEEVKEKLATLSEDKNALVGLWEKLAAATVAGILNVSACDKSTGKQNKITITNDKVRFTLFISSDEKRDPTLTLFMSSL